MQWLSAVIRIGLYLAAGALLGMNFGSPLGGAALAALLVLLVWSYQTWALQKWLSDTSVRPPDLLGIWGEIVARVYKQQRDAEVSQEKLQSMVDYLLESFTSMRDGVVIVESSGGIRWCNEAAQSMLGLRYPDDIGQAITNLVRAPQFNDYIQKGSYAEPLVFTRPGEFKVNLQLAVTQFAEGDTLLFVRDVSDQMRTEQMRRDFVANVSHELRTPLTVITGYLETFLGNPDSLPKPYVKAVEQMVGQAERMESLLKDLLWLSRIESEERSAKRELVDMAALLSEMKEEMFNSSSQQPLQLDIQCQEMIAGDYRELYSAVSNLIFNAFKYSSQGTPVVVSWRQEAGSYLLSVKDSGVGIDPAQFPRLTERFYRVDDSRSSATGGTGLGLAIVKHVAVAHGAELKIESKLGQGSTFTLVFMKPASGSKE